MATVATFGATSVAGTIAISSAITLAARTAEVTTLQIKKSKQDGDSGIEIFNDTIDALFANIPQIIGAIPITKIGGYAFGLFNESSIYASTINLMKMDRFHLSTFLGCAGYSLIERFKNIKTYMGMETGKLGYIISYGFAAREVGNMFYSFASSDPKTRADKRKYVLF